MQPYGEGININKEPLPPPPETTWPSMDKVQEQYPNLCSEEQVWVLEALLSEAHRLRQERTTD